MWLGNLSRLNKKLCQALIWSQWFKKKQSFKWNKCFLRSKKEWNNPSLIENSKLLHLKSNPQGQPTAPLKPLVIKQKRPSLLNCSKKLPEKSWKNQWQDPPKFAAPKADCLWTGTSSTTTRLQESLLLTSQLTSLGLEFYPISSTTLQFSLVIISAMLRNWEIFKQS